MCMSKKEEEEKNKPCASVCIPMPTISANITKILQWIGNTKEGYDKGRDDKTKLRLPTRYKGSAQLPGTQ